MSEAGEQAPGPEGEAPSLFQLLCHSVAAQVHMALGLMPDPVDHETRVEIGAAKNGIDMLAMLEEKTKGNLDEREAKTLGLFLTQLRLIFVERVQELKEQGAAKPAEGEEAGEKAGDGPTIVTP